MGMDRLEPRHFLRELFEAAVAAAQPELTLPAALPSPPPGRTVVIGAGKGAAQLARVFERHWTGPFEGFVVTRYGFGVSCEKVEVAEAGHPVPDEAGLCAAEKMMSMVADLGPDDLVIALLCGGGSALLPLPPDGFSLSDEQVLAETLLRSGMPIGGMNTVRKHFSRIKGGRLAQAAAPARVVSLVVSDVPGDDPAEVASGPTIPSHTTRADALDWLRRYDVALPEGLQRALEEAEEAPRPDDPDFRRHEVSLLSSAGKSLEAAAGLAEKIGLPAVILSDSMEGEARELGRTHAAIAREVALRGRPFRSPVVLLSGGEATVTLRGKGRGGPNGEFLLALALELEGVEDVSALAADTDGIDGSERNAGAFADARTLSRIRAGGHDPQEFLLSNDSWTAFAAAGELFEPGPTGTNVNDFRAILVAARH
ncbi:glycerate 2-kinase [Tranquillimonas alkanivorans]|uniref:Glycerate 2-kinase n=2 Tax=Tranquillimonas alkanivorans TaxID=441119 RepID=A0A1I5UK53_9RHOB|nr:glycerate kinase [Tranquillimonas alkanivorans]SFP95615.1 glycerate 2-kinase [Tranquillimonas alkanivorans]